jgi:hypothetical protein
MFHWLNIQLFMGILAYLATNQQYIYEKCKYYTDEKWATTVI